MSVTCRARYVRRTLALHGRGRDRPERPARLLATLARGQTFTCRARAFSIGLAWPRETARRRPGAARGVVGQGEAREPCAPLVLDDARVR